MNKTIKYIATEIISLAYTITNISDYDIFVRYSGHVNKFDIEIHKQAWTMGTDHLGEKYFNEGDEENLVDILVKLQEIYEEVSTNE